MPQEKEVPPEVEIHIAESGNNKEERNMSDCEEFSLKDNLYFRSLQNSSRSANELIFPQELHDSLRIEINNLTAENGVLRRSLNERECEIQRLQGKLSSGSSYGNIFMGVGRASELAASKIVELSKKVRELTAELEAERARRRRLMDAAKDREKGNTKGEKLAQRKKDSEAKKKGKYGSEAEEKEEDAKSLKEKLQAANMKIAEWQNHCLSLKQELKIADKILASEVGDGCTVEVAKVSMALQSPVYGRNGGWRGRAQQLTLLRSKLSEMEEKLKNPERWSTEAGFEENGEWKKEREKWLQETERLRKEMAEAERIAEEWRRKAEISKARCGSLRAEAEAIRTQMSTIIAKAENNDQLTASLKKSISKLESNLYDKEVEMKRMISSWKKEKEDLIQELMKEQTKVSRLKDVLEEKYQKSEKIEEKTKGMVSTSNHRSISQSTPQEKLTSYHSGLSFEKLQAVCQTAEGERVRLMELATVLNQRLENERKKAVNVFKDLQMERRKNAKLETKIARMELESTSSRSRAYGWSSNRRHSNCSEKESIPEDIKFRLEILEEEKLVLESKINSLQQEKEYDLRKYLSMIEETRDFYLSKFDQLENSHQNKNSQRRNTST